MRIEVLGPIRLRTETGEPVEIPERKVRALLAALVAGRGETIPADTLVDRVWGEELPANPQRVLQAKLSQLRGLLARAGADGRERLVREAGGYRLDVGAEHLDAEDLRQTLARAGTLHDLRGRVRELVRVRALWRGQPYGEFADELWASAEAASLVEARLQAIELEAQALLEVGDARAAFEVVEPLLPEHPIREALVSVAMRAAYASRRQPEALRLYERLRLHLAEELGIDPDPATQELFARILRQDPALIPAADPARARPTGAPVEKDRARGLPRPGTPLVGRAAEVEEIRALLTARRLITVLGLGGVGKTRLATDAAWRSLDEEASTGATPSSVWFVDLTVLDGTTEASPEPVIRLLLSLLGIAGNTELDDADALTRVAQALEEHGALVLLDNCEHVIEAAAAFTQELLGRTERVRVLATSREPLGLPEEQRLPVAPLPTEDGAASPAVELFLLRARAVAPRLEPDEAEVEVIAELCRRLDGLPLAIELAASRVSALSPRDLLDRITDRLDLLARPGRGAPRRQQTLRGMLSWSWELLDQAERTLLRRLAVHPVSWPLDTLESVCADPAEAGGAEAGGQIARPLSRPAVAATGSALRRAEVLPALIQLVDRGLVTVERGVSGVRYRLLETVAAFAAERLEESGERATIAARHLDHHRAMVECAEDYLFGPHARDWVRWLAEEEAHLDRALRWALRNRRGADAVALVISTFWYRWMTGRVEHLAGDLAATAAASEDDRSSRERDARAQVRLLAATFGAPAPVPRGPDPAPDRRPRGGRLGQIRAALAAFAEDEQGRLARMRVQWFAATNFLGDAEHRAEGEELADEAIAALLEAGEENLAALAASIRDWHLADAWDAPPRGLPDGYDAETILRQAGNHYGLSQVLGVTHLVAENRGDTRTSEAVTEEAWQLTNDLGLHAETAYWTVTRAMQALRRGDHDLSRQLAAEAETLARDTGFGFGTALALAIEAAAALARPEGASGRAEELLAAMNPRQRRMLSRQLRRILGEQAVPQVLAGA